MTAQSTVRESKSRTETRFCHHLRPLRVATEAEHLAADITTICAQIDRRLGNPAGTAERGTYFWYWPPTPDLGVEVLTNLHADAVAMLHRIVASEDER